jgi:hypothetical protein
VNNPFRAEAVDTANVSGRGNKARLSRGMTTSDGGRVPLMGDAARSKIAPVSTQRDKSREEGMNRGNRRGDEGGSVHDRAADWKGCYEN